MPSFQTRSTSGSAQARPTVSTDQQKRQQQLRPQQQVLLYVTPARGITGVCVIEQLPTDCTFSTADSLDQGPQMSSESKGAPNRHVASGQDMQRSEGQVMRLSPASLGVSITTATATAATAAIFQNSGAAATLNVAAQDAAVSPPLPKRLATLSVMQRLQGNSRHCGAPQGIASDLTGQAASPGSAGLQHDSVRQSCTQQQHEVSQGNAHDASLQQAAQQQQGLWQHSTHSQGGGRKATSKLHGCSRPLCGVRAVWVPQEMRRRKLATQLLDAARFDAPPAEMHSQCRLATYHGLSCSQELLLACFNCAGCT